MTNGLISIRVQRWKLVMWLGMALILVAGCVPTVPMGPSPDAPVPANPPQFLDSFAVSTIRTGQAWRIFVEGSDPNGDMKDLWVVASQLGGTKGSGQFIPLKGEDRHHFIGYVDLSTSGTWRFSGWETVRAELRIRANTGLQSQLRTHEVVIGSAATEPVPPKWNQAASHPMGTITLNFEGDREYRWPKRRG
jgi:hypothetical protein